MEENELETFLRNLKTDILVFRVPTVKEEGDDYVLSQARRDPTHVIRWTDEQWKDAIENHCYTILPLYLPTIYCAEGAYCGIAIKI